MVKRAKAKNSIKKEQDSLYFGHFLKVVDNKTQQIYLRGIILRKLKFLYDRFYIKFVI